MEIPFTPPTSQANAFNCPHCGAFANQRWGTTLQRWSNGTCDVDGFQISVCANCRSPAFWLKEAMIYPSHSSAPRPNRDLPEDIRADYMEASDILQRSPRGAAALLRLAIQKLCVHVGQPGKNLNDDIGALVKNGLRTHVQRALDVVRVIGNHAVHPGQIDLQDNPEIAVALFGLVNLVAQQMITDPKEAEALYGTLPAAARDAVEKRDK